MDPTDTEELDMSEFIFKGT